MNENRYARLAALAEHQHGVFTRRDLRSVGLSDTTIYNGLARGRFREMLPGVYAVSGSPRTLAQEMFGQVASMPALSAISHRTAAEIWGLTSRGIRALDVVTTRWDRVRRAGVDVHESKDLIAADVTTVDGIPITTPVRTVVDLGAVLPWGVEWALEAGIRQRRFSIAEINAMIARVARKGRRGVGVIRPLIEARKRWDTVTESALEDQFRSLLADFALPAPTSQYVVRDKHGRFVCRADFAYRAERILIELDGEAYHMDRLTFRRDRSKQNRAMVLGWTVLRYTWWDLVEEPHRIRSELRSVLGIADSA